MKPVLVGIWKACERPDVDKIFFPLNHFGNKRVLAVKEIRVMIDAGDKDSFRVCYEKSISGGNGHTLPF